jgi:hypothetical protein
MVVINVWEQSTNPTFMGQTYWFFYRHQDKAAAPPANLAHTSRQISGGRKHIQP